MFDYQTIQTGSADLRYFTMIAKASGSPITSGTVNWYCKAKSGTNSGKWWKQSDGTWAGSETANAMTHDADGHWYVDHVNTGVGAFALDNVQFLEYAKESGDLHVPVGRSLHTGDIEKFMLADQYVDTGVTPWQLVIIQKGTGTLHVGTEILRQTLKTPTGADVTSVDDVIGQTFT